MSPFTTQHDSPKLLKRSHFKRLTRWLDQGTDAKGSRQCKYVCNHGMTHGLTTHF